jgi:dissimilatory sulfite reductase (desulfoviridin) alpha/beta subunit
MDSEPMTRCEEKRLYKVDETKAWRWVEVAVDALSNDGQKEIRCMHCHGHVRVKVQKVGHGSQNIVAHRSAMDSQHCGGAGAIVSANPVT